jgi:hypothetical protein
VQAVAFDPTSQFLASVGSDAGLRLWSDWDWAEEDGQ